MHRLALALLVCATVSARPLKLTELPILAPAGANETEAFAGQELARYLGQISGQALRTGQAGAQMPASGIVIGRGPAEALGIKFSETQYGDDGFILTRRGDRIVLAGINPRGTLYAVYAFLERLGCRWFAPNFAFYGVVTGEYVPRIGSPTVDELNVIEKPSFRWRKKYVEEGQTHTTENLKQMVDWMAKVKMNVFDCPIDYQHEGKTKWDNWRAELTPELRKRGMLIEIGGHGYPNFLPVERYFDQHPEWFGVFKGERSRAANVVFSTANEGAMHEFIANVKAYLKAHPEIDIFDCWPPDSVRWSEAPEDVALGTPTERHMLLLTRLAKELAPEFPRLKIQFVAYSSYVDPPVKSRPAGNMVMDFCPYDRSFESPLFEEKTEMNRKYFEALKAWTSGAIAADRITIYSYITKYAWRSLPIWIPHMIAAESKRYREMGVGGWATYSEPGAWAGYEVDHYFVARYAWNAGLDPDEELADYVKARYRESAEPVLKYIELVEQVAPHAVGIPWTDLEIDKQRRMMARFAGAAKLLEAARTRAGSDMAVAELVGLLEGSRRYAENEMQLRMDFLLSAKGQGRPLYDEIQKLLLERRKIIDEYGKTGVIEGIGRGVAGN
ncbi:MAG TPA: DUF4838 domain-containing protein [Bryobacteraceae bacterium]|jgi:hypothetical protein